MKMKIEALLVALSLNAAMNLGAQGYVAFNNLSPATGLVYILSETPVGYELLNQDVNFELWGGPGGPDPMSMRLIRRWLLSDGSANGINVAPGRFEDPSHSVLEIPGVGPGGTASLVLLAWGGNFSSWEATGLHGLASFSNPTGTASSAPGLTGMESFLIGIPEPSSLALLYCGGLLLAARRCRVRPC